MCQRLISTTFIAVTIALAAGALNRPVRAQDIHIINQFFTINFGSADFGDNGVPHALGSPQAPAMVVWHFKTVNGSLRADADVWGTLFLDSLEPGCVRLTIQFKSSSGAILATRTKDLCVTVTGHNANDATNQALVQESFGSSDLDQVVFRTHPVVNNQIVSSSPAVTITVPNVKKHDVIVNSDKADFGKGLHAGGGPTGSGLVQLTRDKGNVTGLVSGTLYYDSLFSEGCAQVIIDFQALSGTTLHSDTIKKCGPGGNANDAVNQKNVGQTFSSGSLMQIRLRVGQVLPDGSFVGVKKKLCDFKECKDL
jgi:hypothetical protein